MGTFHELPEYLKKETVSKQPEFTESDSFSVEYACGHIVQITPEPQWGKNYYNILSRIIEVKSIISDGKYYDLTDIDSVYSIHVSTYSAPPNDYKLSFSGTIEYLLQAKGHSESTQKELSIAFLRKAVELMKISDVEWRRQDFQRIVWRLKEFGAKDDAEQLDRWYKANVLTDEQEAELIIAGKLDKELSSVQKEIIMVKRVTIEDMLQFDNKPYKFDSPIIKYIEHGGHPFAYMDLSPHNQNIARNDLYRINAMIKEMINSIPLLSSKFLLQVDKIIFSEYNPSYGYSRIFCTPHTYTGKISKFPFSLHFQTRLDIRAYFTIGNLFYNTSGTLEKANVNVWTSSSDYSQQSAGWGFHFGTFGSQFILSSAETTLVPDKYGRATTVYRCQHMIEAENKRTLNRAIFEWMQKHFPEDCPKTISNFSRMRNANSKNYKALIKKVEAAGFVFPQTLDDVAKWPENQ